MDLPSTCNTNKHFILQPFVTRFSAFLVKSSRIMRNFGDFTRDVYGRSFSYYHRKKRESNSEMKTLRNRLLYWEIDESI